MGREHCCIDVHNALEPCELNKQWYYTVTLAHLQKYMASICLWKRRLGKLGYISPQILSLPRCSDGPSNILMANAEPSNWKNNKHHVCVHYTFCTIPGEVRSTSYSIIGFIDFLPSSRLVWNCTRLI